MLYLMMHSIHFIYGYMASDSQRAKEETRCHHMGYSVQIAARVLLNAPPVRIAHTMAFVTPVVEHWLE